MGQSVNYGQVRKEIADIFNRDDIDDAIGKAVQSTHVELVEVVGNLSSLIDDADTNALLLYQPAYYVYGGAMRVAAYMSDTEMMARYTALFTPMLTDLYMGAFQCEFPPNVFGYRPVYNAVSNSVTWPPVLP